ITLPRDIGREPVTLNHLPLRHRYGPHTHLSPCGSRALAIHAPTSVRIRTCVYGMMEHTPQQSGRQASPFHFTTPRPPMHAHTHTDLVTGKITVHLAEGT